MAKTKISKVAKDLNVSALPTVIDFLRKKDINIDENPNTSVEDDVVQLLMKRISKDKDQKKDLTTSSTHARAPKPSNTCKRAGNNPKMPHKQAPPPYSWDKIDLDDHGQDSN